MPRKLKEITVINKYIYTYSNILSIWKLYTGEGRKGEIDKEKKIMVRRKPKIRRQKFKYTTINIKGLHLSTENGYQSGFFKNPAICLL